MPPLEHPKSASPSRDEPSGGADPSSSAWAGQGSDGAQASAPQVVTANDDGGLAVIVRSVAVVGVLAAVAVGYFAGRGAGASAAYGATLGLANLVALGRMVRAFFGTGRASIAWIVAALSKLAVLVLAMYLPVRASLVQVVPFMIGFGALPLGIVLGQLLIVPPKSKEK
jgi:hypothetical protein